MAIAPLIVAVRTTGANQLRNLSSGFRQASQAGSRAAAEMRRDFDRAVVALNRANAEAQRTRREFNRAPSSETARAMHMAALAARQASHQVDNLADQLRQANRAATSLVGRMAAVAAAAMTMGSGMSGSSQMMAGLMTGLVALAPAIGAALQGAIIAGLGAVGLGAAIFAAFKDADIRAAWTGMLKGVGDDLKNFGKQLGPALVESANMFRIAWGRASDSVRHLFGNLSTTIQPLTRGLIRMMQEAGPGIKKAFATAVPVLMELANLLPTLGRGISSFFDAISDKETALKGLRLIVYALAGSLMILGGTIKVLSAWFGFWSKLAEKVYSALSKIPALGLPFKYLAETLHAINEPAESLDSNLRVMGGTALYAAQASRQAAQAMQEMNNQITEMLGKTMNADEAMLAWAAAIRGVTESVKENGRNLDINTEKGHANVTAILATVQAADRKRQADIELAGGENAAASAVAAANSAFRQQLDQLAALMRKLGFTEAQIQSLLGKYYALANAPNIDKTVTVTYRTRGDATRGVGAGNLAPGGPNLGYASGTESAVRGWALVGERGPELVNFRGGEQVLDNQTSRRAMTGGSRGASSGGTSWSGPMGGLDALFFRWLQKAVRTGQLRLT